MVSDMEKNKQTLRDALEDLPSYAAPDGIWAKLEEELNQEAKDAPLQVSLRGLPTYEPPAAPRSTGTTAWPFLEWLRIRW